MTKTVDPAKEKERKQKIFVAVGGSALLILLAIMGPGMWRSLHPKPAKQPAKSTATAAPACVRRSSESSRPTCATSSSPSASWTARQVSEPMRP